MLGKYWSARFRRWPRDTVTGPGFTVVVPVPGNLPVFTDLALAVVREQHSPSRVATIVVPDRPSPAVAAAVERHRSDWSGGELRLRNVVRPERWILPRLGDPGRNQALRL